MSWISVRYEFPQGHIDFSIPLHIYRRDGWKRSCSAPKSL